MRYIIGHVGGHHSILIEGQFLLHQIEIKTEQGVHWQTVKKIPYSDDADGEIFSIFRNIYDLGKAAAFKEISKYSEDQLK